MLNSPFLQYAASYAQQETAENWAESRARRQGKKAGQ